MLLFITIVNSCCPVSLYAIVRHPCSDASIAFMDHPSDKIIGKWNGNASCVAIGPDMVITTCHQKGGVGSRVYIDGRQYIVSECYIPPGYNGTEPDVRIARLANADLQSYVQVIDSSMEIADGSPVCIAGFGRTRGQEQYCGNNIYAYKWSGTGSETVNWCSNVIEYTLCEMYLIAYFDGPDPEVDCLATEYEGIVAEYDSGGGWFLKCQGVWYLVGLTYNTETNYYAKFRVAAPDYAIADPDWFAAYSLRCYADWIADYITFHSADIDLNGQVDIADFSMISLMWHKNSPPHRLG
ncbi:MAG: hypothetical protein JXM68_14165, partial [Sedimentisphaerales bacterium]|nr:hypothetical protein [Sedimentisphaerales bacterium]